MDNNFGNNNNCSEENNFQWYENGCNDCTDGYDDYDDEYCENCLEEDFKNCCDDDFTNQGIVRCPCGKPKGDILVETLLKCNCLEPLTGARVNLYKINGCKSELVASKLSDCNGKVNFNELEDGIYKVVEVIDPCMFEKPNYHPCDEIKITPCTRKEEITIINKIKNKDDIIGKAIVDVRTVKCGSVIPLEGIEVELYKCIKGCSKFICKQRTNACGTCSFDNLPEGYYRIVAKLDMCLFSNIIYDPSDDFSINCKEQCVTTTVNCISVEEIRRGSIEALCLLGDCDNEPIEGIKCNLYKLDECQTELIASKATNCRGLVKFENLDYGLYKLIQVTPDEFREPVYIPTNEFIIDRKHRKGQCVVLNRLCCNNNCCG